jgi:osmotically-inducible protein OsmY
MFKLQYITGLLICMALVMVVAGCAGTKKTESTGQYVDDSAITTKVKAEILKNEKLKSFQISVETFKGDVQLSGFVDSPQMVSEAGRVAKSVDGVRSVKNNLIVK